MLLPVMARAEIFDNAEQLRPLLPGMPAPATFIIGTDGRIQFGYVNSDYSVRLAPGMLLAAGRACVDGAHRRLQRNGGD